MVREVICVGTIWDLDDYVYPELEEMTGMTPWNFSQLVRHQLCGSREEIPNIDKKPMMVRTQYGVKVRACCASCFFKEIMRNGSRTCSLHDYKQVASCYGCNKWIMAEWLMNAGLGTGIVRNRETKKIILQ